MEVRRARGGSAPHLAQGPFGGGCPRQGRGGGGGDEPNSGRMGEVFAGLLEQIDEPIAQIDADGAYDTRQAYQVAADRGGGLGGAAAGECGAVGGPIIRAPRRWPPLPSTSRGWPAGNGPRVIITGVSRKMPCIASNNCSEIAWLAGNWKRK